jgi:uncharacterized membrane protein
MHGLKLAWEALRSSFWFVPALLAIVAVGLSVGMSFADEAIGAKTAAHLGWIYSGGPEGARGVLSAIAGSVIGVAGTTFSITIAVLSLTSGQFGPRLLRNFMRDLGNQIVLGTFTATFLYCLLVLRTIRGTDQVTYVPHLSVTLGVALAVLSVGVLIYFVNHVAESIQVSHLIEMVGLDADQSAARLFPSPPPRSAEAAAKASDDLARESKEAAEVPAGVPVSVCADRIGYLESIDEEGVFAIAKEHGLVVRVEVRPGDYILPSMKLLSVWPDAHGEEAHLRRAFSCGRDRTTLQDAEFAFLQLAEVAVRALSPGINDPFTAMMCVDRITASLCVVAECAWPPACRRDEHGAVRVLWRAIHPRELVEAAYGHVRRAAKDAPSVLIKLRESVDVLLERAYDPALRGALQRERTKLASLGPSIESIERIEAD